MVNKLSGQLEQKEQRISKLEQKVQLLELQADGVAQSILAGQTFVSTAFQKMKTAKIQRSSMRKCESILLSSKKSSSWPEIDRQGQRRSQSIIVIFASERTRYGVYRARFKLKDFNATMTRPSSLMKTSPHCYSCRSQTAKEEQEDTRHVDCCRQHTRKIAYRHQCANQVES